MLVILPLDHHCPAPTVPFLNHKPIVHHQASLAAIYINPALTRSPPISSGAMACYSTRSRSRIHPDLAPVVLGAPLVPLRVHPWRIMETPSLSMPPKHSAPGTTDKFLGDVLTDHVLIIANLQIWPLELSSYLLMPTFLMLRAVSTWMPSMKILCSLGAVISTTSWSTRDTHWQSLQSHLPSHSRHLGHSHPWHCVGATRLRSMGRHGPARQGRNHRQDLGCMETSMARIPDFNDIDKRPPQVPKAPIHLTSVVSSHCPWCNFALRDCDILRRKDDWVYVASTSTCTHVDTFPSFRLFILCCSFWFPMHFCRDLFACHSVFLHSLSQLFLLAPDGHGWQTWRRHGRAFLASYDPLCHQP